MARSVREMEARDNEGYATRESELRAHDMIEEYNMEWRSAFAIPRGVEKEGYSYYWATTNIKTSPIFEVERLSSRGWTPVPADRAPNFAADPLARNPHAAKFICTMDAILMERPAIYLKKERAAYYYENDRKIKSLRGVSDSYGTVVSYGGYNNNSFSKYGHPNNYSF